MSHPPQVVEQVEGVVLRTLRTGFYAMPDDPTGLISKAAQIAREVLDTLVVEGPDVTQELGRVRLDWPQGVDPDRSPSDGAQYLLVDVRLFARLVEQANRSAEPTETKDAPLPCPACGAKVRINKDGTISRHLSADDRLKDYSDRRTCVATWRRPEEFAAQTQG